MGGHHATRSEADLAFQLGLDKVCIHKHMCIAHFSFLHYSGLEKACAYKYMWILKALL
jgi:hypothetical protein